MKKVLAVAVILVLAISLGACAQKPQVKEKPPIKIGVQVPLTGDWAYEGQGMLNGINMLAEQINNAGGLLDGRKIEVIPADDKSDAKEAALAAQKLINSGVIAVVGSYASTLTEASQGLYNDKGIVQITPSSTATKLSEHGYKRFFRTCFLDDRQGLFAAKFIVETLGCKKVGVVHDNTTYAKGLAEWTKKYLEDAGATVVFFDALTPKEKDYSAILTRLKKAEPEAWYYTGYFPEAALLVRQAADVGLKARFVAGNAVNNPEFVKLAGVEYAKGTIVTTEPLPTDLEYPEAKKFLQDYKTKYGEYPGSIWHLMAADAFRLIVEAIRQTNSDDPGKIAEYLHTQLKDFPGITGPILGFDERGDRKGTIHKAYVVNEKGEFVPYGK
ncbi:MAG: branched-chain amino acid ABC transporter substrate-binding protein [Firmicutes bacterium]|nr:branched-chain amino acid ABC transporter substrate-binding protein [Bacillota bacterium]